MKLVMKVLFAMFIASIIFYVIKADMFGPRIMLEKNMSLDFNLGQEVDDWSEYFYLYDRKEGLLDDKHMTIYTDDINLNVPGNQYIYVEATDVAGNTSTRTFEIKVSSGYRHFDFENFVNNQKITTDTLQLNGIDFSQEPLGISDELETNASIASSIGSQNLLINVEPTDGINNGVDLRLNVPEYHQYYLKYSVQIDAGNKSSETDVIKLPIISNKSSTMSVELATTGDGKLVIIDNINDQSFTVANSDLTNRSTIEIDFSIDDKLGEPDLIQVKLNDKVVYTIDNIDLGYEQFNQLLISVYSDSEVTDSYNVYLDDMKMSMLKEDLIG
ncbi:hypothetical protein R2F61_01365 [Mollicutes bacterium LVI A0078]|nr:hypothetical protein RZE84_01360 [Mollicutes bacterium LVI A0075]WOO91227.1 hypothetical protein R2F61_01365 [Mollicutes bacterium LVI A0078]